MKISLTTFLIYSCINLAVENKISLNDSARVEIMDVFYLKNN